VIRRVQIRIIGFLKADIGADFRRFQATESRHIEGGDFHIDAADGVFPDASLVYRPDGRKKMVEIIVARLATEHHDPLVSFPEKHLGFRADLIRGEHGTPETGVFLAERAVQAGIRTGVPDIERCEKHHAPPVNGFLGISRRVEQRADHLGRVYAQERCDLFHRQSFEFPCLLEDTKHFPLRRCSAPAEFPQTGYVKKGFLQGIHHDRPPSSWSEPISRRSP
jgi:hypothetical protein